MLAALFALMVLGAAAYAASHPTPQPVRATARR